jgi:hypothetical protein
MAALKDKSICLLGQLTGQSIATGANPTLFTVPAGRVARIMQIVFRDPSASAAAAVNLSCNGFPGTMSLVNLITANTGFVVFEAAPAAGAPAAPTQGIEVATGVNVVLTITTGAAGVTCGIDVFGYLTP